MLTFNSPSIQTSQETIMNDEILLKEKETDLVAVSLTSDAAPEYRNDTSRLYRQLMIEWQNELGSPELLSYWEGVDQVREIFNELEDLVIDDAALGCSLPFGAEVLIRCEKERMRYMLVEYLRGRLLKIEHLCDYLLSNEDTKSLMSKAELIYCTKFASIQHDLQHAASGGITDDLPQEIIDFDNIRSQRRPNQFRHVFAQFRETAHGVLLNPAASPETIEAGELYIVPYDTVKKCIAEGKAIIV